MNSGRIIWQMMIVDRYRGCRPNAGMLPVHRYTGPKHLTQEHVGQYWHGDSVPRMNQAKQKIRGNSEQILGKL